MLKIMTIVLTILGLSLTGCAEFSQPEVVPQLASSTPIVPASTTDNLSPPAENLSTQNLTAADNGKVNAALDSSAIGQASRWDNPETGSSVSVTPTKNVTLKGNPYCREYRITVTSLNQQQQTHHTACRQADGSWQATTN